VRRWTLLLLAGCAAAGPADVHVPATGALGPYSSAVSGGGLMFLSGKIAAADARRGEFAAEADAALDAVVTDLRAAGLSLLDVVAVTVHLTDMGTYTAFNQVYERRMPEPWPARTCVAVSALPGGARVEITVVARRH
jgi:2-iminobutanoate/2-iminopropanoate deaminase